MAVPEEVKKKLRERLESVMSWRRIHASCSGNLLLSKVTWERENAILLNSFANSEENMRRAEEELRQEAVQAFLATGEKRPSPGVEVRLYDVLIYDSLKAFEWALEHKQALQLSKPVFEKIAKADKPEFVTITQEPRALIASDLEKALANQEGN